MGLSNSLPYVYRLTHKPTGRFYIGYRQINVRMKLRSEEDLWIRYFSSSREVKQLPKEEIEACVLAEFFEAIDALKFEQQLLEREWNNPLLINKAKFSTNDFSKLIRCGNGVKPSPETLARRSVALKGRIFSEEHRKKLSQAQKGKKIEWSDERREHYRNIRSSVPVTEAARKGLSEGQRRRFLREGQSDLNRKAGRAGYEARKPTFRALAVRYPDGEEKRFDCVRDFFNLTSGGYNRTLIYFFANKHSGKTIKQGKFSGFTFSWAS